ncbi:DUF362 domain-containing protein [candidate division KSB1 bacterium]|nr:DUF362 domain-containing protein [candidate division KSB1 bacterium]
MKVRKKSYIRIIVIVCLFTIWISWDLTQAGKNLLSLYRSYRMEEEFDSVTEATAKVGIARSDDVKLAHPTAIDNTSITYQTIEEMVRQAIKYAGGIDWIVQSGNMVLLKPNIVDPEPPGTGEVTDVRVIKALIKIIDEIDPGKIEIVVGEGSPRPMDYEMEYQSTFGTPQWTKLWDKSGYQDLLTDPYLEGINFRLSNLNGSPPEDPWQDLVLVDVPGGGEAQPQGGQYYIHKDVLNADVFITVPVMKIHRPGITVALKNQIGIAPSTMYGFSKTEGVPQKNYKVKLVHQSLAPMYWTDKEIVDLCNLAQIKYAVVDAIACLEQKKAAIRKGDQITNLVRMNMIVAGPDPVAVDHVCTRLMGMNPDDIEHITLAEKVGLGTNNPDNITIIGADLETTKKRFIKFPDAEGDFGQGNRTWLLNGPYSIDSISEPINNEFIPDEANLTPTANKDNWSEAVFFNDDRINLRDYYNLSSGDDVVSYAFCYFTAPKDQQAELWIGSDEALKIYINGNEVYSYSGTRSFKDNQFVSAKVMADIKAGENSLLVKTLQKYGGYDFCINICEPESNPNYDGNRIWGLKFHTASNVSGIKQPAGKTNVNFEVFNAYPNPFNGSVSLSYRIFKPGKMTVRVFNIYGQKIRTLLNERVQTTGNHVISWDGKDSNGNFVSTGTYFVRFQKDLNQVDSKKILFLK